MTMVGLPVVCEFIFKGTFAVANKRRVPQEHD